MIDSATVTAVVVVVAAIVVVVVVVVVVFAGIVKPCSERPTQLNTTSSENVQNFATGKKTERFSVFFSVE